MLLKAALGKECTQSALPGWCRLKAQGGGQRAVGKGGQRIFKELSHGGARWVLQQSEVLTLILVLHMKKLGLSEPDALVQQLLSIHSEWAPDERDQYWGCRPGSSLPNRACGLTTDTQAHTRGSHGASLQMGSMTVKMVGSGPRLPGLKSRLYHLLAV